MHSHSLPILYTIGFTRKSAAEFFGKLIDNRVRAVIDTRLHNTSQLSGFAKSVDLRYFLNALGGIEYQHEPLLAPEADMLAAYRSKRLAWPQYEREFVQLLERRKIETRIDKASLGNACLLCSEASPHHCHRRLVAEYLQRHWGGFEIEHL